MSLTAVDVCIVALYNKLTDDMDGAQVAHCLPARQGDATDDSLLAGLVQQVADEVDADGRMERFAAAQVYVLAVRYRAQTVGGGGAVSQAFDDALASVGTRLLEQFPDAGDATLLEPDLRSGVELLLDTGRFGSDVAGTFGSAFPSTALTDNGDGTWDITGAATEFVMMLIDMATHLEHCRAENVTVTLADGTKVQCVRVRMERCLVAPFEKAKLGVDPLQWPGTDHFFKSVTLLSGGPATPGGPWVGTVQEVVGPIANGAPITTNLRITYLEQPGLAVTAYDLASPADPVTADDNTVLVDFGMVAVYEEGPHRRFLATKVVGLGSSIIAEWLCPLWAMSTALAGYSM